MDQILVVNPKFAKPLSLKKKKKVKKKDLNRENKETPEKNKVEGS